MTTTDALIAQAQEAFEAGFTSKAGQKRAFEDLGRAYRIQVDLIRNDLLSVDRADRTDGWDDLYWGLPDLHNWKAKHSEMYQAYPDTVATIEQLVELRKAIKAAPIIKVERETMTAREQAITKSVREIMEARKASYERGLRLHDLFGGLPVHANVHLVTNQHGTTFLRAFYYLAGELTALNVILAVLDTKAREAKQA